MSIYPYGNVWPLGDSKTYGLCNPGSCGPRDPMWVNFLSKVGGTLVGNITGGCNPDGSNFTPCPISGLPLEGSGFVGAFTFDILSGIPSNYASLSGIPVAGILYIGTNDMIYLTGGGSGYSLDGACVNLAGCVSALIAQNSAVTWFVCNLDLMPALTGSPFIFQYNAYIGALVKQYQRQGAPVYLIDLASAPGITWDGGGIHQDTAGYAATSARMVAAMSTLRPAG